jgi:uncharacterized membrane protein YhiD involved in acid resistance
MSQLNFYVIPFLAYVLVANPATYKAVRGILGSWVSSAEGLATFPGLLLHALVYVLLVGFLMRVVPQISGFKTRKDQQSSEYVHWAQRNEVAA